LRAIYTVALLAALMAVGPVAAQDQSSSSSSQYKLPKTVEIVNVEVNGQPVTFYHADELGPNAHPNFEKVAILKPGSEVTVTLTLQAKESGKIDVMVAPAYLGIPPEYSIIPEDSYRKTMDVTAGQKYTVQFKFKVGTEPNPYALGPYYFMTAQVTKHVANISQLKRSDILDDVVWKVKFATGQGTSSSSNQQQINVQQEIEKIKQMIEQQIQQRMKTVATKVYNYMMEMRNYVMSLPVPSALDMLVNSVVGPVYARTVSGLVTGAIATAVATLVGIPFPENLIVGGLVGAVLNVPAPFLGLLPQPPQPPSIQQLLGVQPG